MADIMHKHHVIPKHAWKRIYGSLDGCNNPNNIEICTIQQHASYHYERWMLVGDWQDYCAWIYLINGMTDDLHLIRQLNGKKNGTHIRDNKLGIFSWSEEEKQQQRLLAAQKAKETLTGVPKTKEHKQNLKGARPHVNQSGSNNNFARKCLTPYGEFGSVTDAHKYITSIGIDIKYDTLHYKFRSGKPGWEYLEVPYGRN